MKPLDSNDGALVAARSEPEESCDGQPGPSVPDSDADVLTPRAQSEIVTAAPDLARATPSGASRFSRIVPLGTTDERTDALDRSDAAPTHDSDGVRRGPDPVVAGAAVGDPVVGPVAGSALVGSPIVSSLSPSGPDAARADLRGLRAAARVGAFAVTRVGPGLEAADDDDEATTVDSGAALTDDERDALARRIHSVMEETLPHGTPLPEPVRPFDAAESARDRRSPFKRTMLLGVPKVEPPDLATPSASPVPPTSSAPGAVEPALLASVVRVVGPPTQPPPRRSRRVPASTSDEPNEPPDHEAFVLTHAIVAPDRSRPAAVPPPPSRRTAESLPWSVDGPATSATNHAAVAAARSSLPGMILPPAPRAEDFEPASSPVAASPIAAPSISVAPPAPLLRATIEPPASLSRTRPPMSQRFVPDLPLDELPASDPFAGFVAPPPSLAQRWLVVVVVALAVVGLCSIAAIAFGFLGKTGW